MRWLVIDNIDHHLIRRLRAPPIWLPLEGAADEGGWRSSKGRLLEKDGDEAN
jgi:hypothetical protein